MTPDQKYYKAKPYVQHLRFFGSLAYVHILDIKRTKLDSKTIKCIFVGYDSESKGYRLFDPQNKKFTGAEMWSLTKHKSDMILSLQRSVLLPILFLATYFQNQLYPLNL